MNKRFPQLISPCGGGNDNNGILWTIKGDFYAYPRDNILKLEKEHARWYPSVNPESIVLKGYGIPIPDKNVLASKAMDEYKRLIKTSKIKEVKKENEVFITREYL